MIEFNIEDVVLIEVSRQKERPQMEVYLCGDISVILFYGEYKQLNVTWRTLPSLADLSTGNHRDMEDKRRKIINFNIGRTPGEFNIPVQDN